MSMSVKKQLCGAAVMTAAMIAMCVLSSAQAVAQGRGGFGMMRGSMLKSSLLTIEEVQTELELSEEQIEKVVGPASELNSSMRDEMRAIFQDGGGREEMEELINEMREEEKEILAHLNEDQTKRLNQLHIQRIGTGVLQNEEVIAALELTEEQKTSIQEIVAGLQDRFREAMQEGGREAFQKIGAEVEAELNEILTEEQREKLAEMKGEPFEFPEPQRRDGGRRSDFLP